MRTDVTAIFVCLLLHKIAVRCGGGQPVRANRYCVISQGQQPGIRFPPPDYTPSAGEKGRLSANVESAYPRFGNTLETFLSRGLGRLSANLKSAYHRSEIPERPFSPKERRPLAASPSRFFRTRISVRAVVPRYTESGCKVLNLSCLEYLALGPERDTCLSEMFTITRHIPPSPPRDTTPLSETAAKVSRQYFCR